MRHVARLLALIAVLAAAAGCAAAPDFAPIAGEWSLAVTYDGDTPGGTINCAVQQEDGELNGRCDDLATLTGEVRGTLVSFEIIEAGRGRDRGAPGWTTTFRGTVDTVGTRMSGTLAVSGQRGRFTATRVAPRRELAPPSA